MIAIYKWCRDRGDDSQMFVDLVPTVGAALDAIHDDECGPCPGTRYELVRRVGEGPRSYATLWEHTTRIERAKSMAKWIKKDKP